MAKTNRLAGETSPYLLLHRHNPVDWYPWGEEALTRAREEDKPIFLSVGYATCYWCHVMERESFADAGTARLMNESFVNIKVDREERPELDEIYMAATQIFTHQGGWPNSVFLTPDLRPFFAGTYFPPADRHGRPSFKTVLLSMREAWRSRRDDVETQAEEIAGAMRRMLEERGAAAEGVPPASVAEQSMDALAERFDAEWGGFGGAPKFPSPSNLHLLLDLADDGDERAADMATETLDKMARGGVYDQLAGGFHRYATDREWKVPHFEKMLYDNGQLLEIYARDYARTGEEERARIVRETARFLERELTSPEGAFWSAIDAEVSGREGAYHVWTLDELVAVLGEEEAGFLAPILGFDGDPFFEGGSYVLHLPLPLAEQAERRRLDRGELLEQVKDLESKLLEAREKRPKPLVDDKVLTDWNGLVIAGLATAAGLIGDAGMLAMAERAADFILEHLRGEDGRLRHTWRDGEARIDAFLVDYAFLVHGLLALYEASGEERWLRSAVALTEEQIERLEDAENGGFFVAAERGDVLFRSKEIFDGALPASNAVAALNLIELARHQDEEKQRWLGVAERTLRAFGGLIEARPDGARMLSVAVRRYHAAAAAPTGEEAAAATVANLVEKASKAVVKGRLHVDPEEDADGFQEFHLVLEIKGGWHLYAARLPETTSSRTGASETPSSETDSASGPPVEPTSLEAEDGEVRAVDFPPGEPLEGPLPARGYHGKVEVRGRLRGAPAVRLRFQPCDAKRCLAATSIVIRAEESAVH